MNGTMDHRLTNHCSGRAPRAAEFKSRYVQTLEAMV